MKIFALGAGLALIASSACAIELDCYEDPRTNAHQCIDAKNVRSTKDGIRYTKLYTGGPAEVRATNMTVHVNCDMNVLHLKDRQGVSFAGGSGSQTAATRSLRNMICNAKIKSGK